MHTARTSAPCVRGLLGPSDTAVVARQENGPVRTRELVSRQFGESSGVVPHEIHFQPGAPQHFDRMVAMLERDVKVQGNLL